MAGEGESRLPVGIASGGAGSGTPGGGEGASRSATPLTLPALGLFLQLLEEARVADAAIGVPPYRLPDGVRADATVAAALEGVETCVREFYSIAQPTHDVVVRRRGGFGGSAAVHALYAYLLKVLPLLLTAINTVRVTEARCTAALTALTDSHAELARRTARARDLHALLAECEAAVGSHAAAVRAALTDATGAPGGAGAGSQPASASPSASAVTTCGMPADTASATAASAPPVRTPPRS